MFQGNTFGNLFKVTTFGESHGVALGVTIDGCPAGIEVDLDFIRNELDRRKPGQSNLVTPRKENDDFEILSGIFEGKTTGTPIGVIFRNTDAKSKDYSDIKDSFRPGHADFTYHNKYGHRDYRGGGRSSARETVARVFAGAVAKQILKSKGVGFLGGLVQVGHIKADKRDWAYVESNPVRSTDPDKTDAMITLIEDRRRERESVGGIVEVRAQGVPVGLGEPVFSKLSALIGGAMFSIPAVKGVEIGDGFLLVEKKGSESNDEMDENGFRSNHHGGVLGGLSSGEEIIVRLAIKPTSSLPKEQDSVDVNGTPVKVVTKGRHDPCVAIRAVPIAEAMLALVLVNLLMEQEARRI